MIDLESVCSEFAKNFSALSLRYETQRQELCTAVERQDKTQKELESAMEEIHRLENVKKDLEKEVTECQTFKERYYSSVVALEHLKGRVESSRKALGEKEAEHQQELEQLRNQKQDLLRRIESNEPAVQLLSVKSQRGELEEHCAVLNGKLLEERERANQQVMTSNAALRDLQAHCLELEQRCRHLEAEITSQRNASRRYQEVRFELQEQNEKLQQESTRSLLSIGFLQQEITALRGQFSKFEADFATQLEDHSSKATSEKNALLVRVSTLSSTVQELTLEKESLMEKLTRVTHTQHQKVLAARTDISSELESNQKLITELKDENQRLRQRVRTLERESAECGSTLLEKDKRISGLEEAKRVLTSQLDVAQHQNGWAVAERDRFASQLQTMEQIMKEKDELSARYEQLTGEFDKLQIRLGVSEAQASAATKRSENAVRHAQKIEEKFIQRISKLKKELREPKANRMKTKELAVTPASDDVIESLRLRGEELNALQKNLTKLGAPVF